MKVSIEIFKIVMAKARLTKPMLSRDRLLKINSLEQPMPTLKMAVKFFTRRDKRAIDAVKRPSPETIINLMKFKMKMTMMEGQLMLRGQVLNLRSVSLATMPIELVV